MAYTPDDYLHSAMILIVLQSCISAQDRIRPPNTQWANLWSPIKLVVVLKVTNPITVGTPIDLPGYFLLTDSD